MRILVLRRWPTRRLHPPLATASLIRGRQELGTVMLDLRQLHGHVHSLNTGDVATRREAIRSLKQHESQEWAATPAQAVRPLVESLQRQLHNGRQGADAVA